MTCFSNILNPSYAAQHLMSGCPMIKSSCGRRTDKQKASHRRHRHAARARGRRDASMCAVFLISRVLWPPAHSSVQVGPSNVEVVVYRFHLLRLTSIPSSHLWLFLFSHFNTEYYDVVSPRCESFPSLLIVPHNLAPHPSPFHARSR